jgi:hypothetical protein
LSLISKNRQIIQVVTAKKKKKKKKKEKEKSKTREKAKPLRPHFPTCLKSWWYCILFRVTERVISKKKKQSKRKETRNHYKTPQNTLVFVSLSRDRGSPPSLSLFYERTCEDA